MRCSLGELYNRSAKAGMVTPALLQEIIAEVKAWQGALRQSDRNEEVRASETFRALTACLQRGRHYHDAEGCLVDTLPLGNPELEGKLWHLWQTAQRPGVTDREKSAALEQVLVAWTIPSGRFANAPVGREDAMPRRTSTPRQLLTGWHEIAKVLEVKYQDREKIKSLNARCDGPITNRGKGTQPMVYRDKLLEWWNSMDIRYQELANQREGRKLSTESQYNYGRDGTVAPEIGGGVRKRRRVKPRPSGT
jgi:hypothetical protein